MSDIVERLREQAELVPVVPRAPWKAMAEAADEITSLRAQVAALEGDAGRYRWLRQQNCILDSGRSGIFTAIRMTEADGGFSHNDLIAMEGMDAAIDAALAARKGG